MEHQYESAVELVEKWVVKKELPLVVGKVEKMVWRLVDLWDYFVGHKLELVKEKKWVV